MTEQAYDPRQALTSAQRQEFYDWCATQYGYPKCRYCGRTEDLCLDPYSHAERAFNWDLYQALKASAEAPLPIPSAEFLDGFWGHNYE